MKMKCGKAGGKSGVLPKLLKCCSGCLLDQLVELFQTVWKEGSIFQEWKDVLVVPIPKKGDLSQVWQLEGNWSIGHWEQAVGQDHTLKTADCG